MTCVQTSKTEKWIMNTDMSCAIMMHPYKLNRNTFSLGVTFCHLQFHYFQSTWDCNRTIIGLVTWFKQQTKPMNNNTTTTSDSNHGQTSYMWHTIYSNLSHAVSEKNNHFIPELESGSIKQVQLKAYKLQTFLHNLRSCLIGLSSMLSTSCRLSVESTQNRVHSVQQWQVH